MSQTSHKNTTARRLGPEAKKSIALDALSGMGVTQAARKNAVCRNSVYVQMNKAEAAMDAAFADKTDNTVLFYLPVSTHFIGQVVLALVLIAKASYRDAMQFLHDIFDYPISIGTVASIVDGACDRAAPVNAAYDLSAIRESAADEVFHRHQPILTTVDINSRFCALLEKEEHRDADSWGVHLLDMIDRGFQPDINISDQASGLKKAFEDVLPSTELRFDHFHIIKASKDLIRFLKNRKESATTRAIVLYSRIEKAKKRGKDHRLSDALAIANKTMAAAEMRYERVDILCTWLQYDVLQLPSSCPADRDKLFDFIVDELLAVADEPRIRTYVRSLINQKDDLLAVANSLDRKFHGIAQRYGVSLHDTWAIGYTARFGIQAPTYHVQSEKLESCIGSQYDQIEDDVLTALASTHRCSSMVENFNSRLKPYLDERKTITRKKLGLYQFILNHRPFQRSHHARLVGKTPAEALTGKSHLHWLELLGYQRFQRTALAA
jgi:hypothetical protein